MKQNGLFTFIFACIPGAGQMYLGLMKRGLSIMLIFFLITVATSIFTIFGWTLTIIGFASFFDTFNNARKLREGQVLADDFIYLKDKELLQIFQNHKMKLEGKMPKFIGITVICVGIYMLLDQFYYALYNYLHMFSSLAASILGSIWRGIPQVVVSVIIIIIGIKLVKGPNKHINDDLIEYKPDASQDKESK